MVGSRRSRARIAVHNTNVEGVRYRSPLPTFVLDTVGLSLERVAWELSAVGTLQTISPVFRVVVSTDQPIFAHVRGYGWPVEHIMSPEHQESLHSGIGVRAYVRQRNDIVAAHYENSRVVRVDGRSTLASKIAAEMGVLEIYETVVSLIGDPPLGALPVSALSATTIAALQTNGRLIVEGMDGRVEISSSSDYGRAVCVIGGLLGENDATRVSRCPSWISVIRASFDSQSTHEFESYVYSSLARLIGRDLAIVAPWRVGALRSKAALFWIDLGVELDSDGFRVVSEYAHAYSVLEPSGVLNWESARKYGAVRKISRTRSKSYDLYSS